MKITRRDRRPYATAVEGRRGPGRAMNARALATALTLVVAASGILGGCGGTSGSDRAAKDGARNGGGWRLPDHPDPDVRDKMHGLFSGASVRMAATEELLWRCMAKKGFRSSRSTSISRSVRPEAVSPCGPSTSR